MTKLLGICGSSGSDSTSSILINVAAEAARQAGAEVEILELSELLLPIMRVDGKYDREYPHIDEIRSKTGAADGFLFASPEYHGSMSGSLKNYLDFHYKEFAGKAFGLLVATGGTIGVSCATHMRSSISTCHGWVLPYQVAVKSKDMDDDGGFKDDSAKDRVERLGRDTAIYAELLLNQFESDKSASGNNGFAGWHSK